MYVDQTYYTDSYYGDDLENFDKLESRASDLIDQMTGYKIQSLDDLTPFQQTQVKKAVCAQIEYMAQAEGLYHGQSQITSMKIGSFSYNEANGANESLTREQTRTSPAVIDYLMPTGLLYSGVRTW